MVLSSTLRSTAACLVKHDRLGRYLPSKPTSYSSNPIGTVTTFKNKDHLIFRAQLIPSINHILRNMEERMYSYSVYGRSSKHSEWEIRKALWLNAQAPMMELSFLTKN